MSRLGNQPFFSFPFQPQKENSLPPLSLPPTRNVYKTLWDEKVAHYSTKGAYTRGTFRLQILQKNSKYSVNAAAVPVILPNKKEAKIAQFHAMPAKTLKQKIEKEKACRELLLEQYEMKSITHDHNNALRAVINCLDPSIPKECEEITAHLLRGDLIQHVLRHPEAFNENNGVAFHDWYKKMQTKESLGFLEIGALSHMLKTPIHILSFDKLEENSLLPQKEMCFGKEYRKEPILLYFDPVHIHFMSLS